VNESGDVLFLTLSDRVVDHVVVHEHAVRAEDPDRRGEAVVERAALEVGLVGCDLLCYERIIIRNQYFNIDSSSSHDTG